MPKNITVAYQWPLDFGLVQDLDLDFDLDLDCDLD